MKISDSSVLLTSSHQEVEKHSVKQSLRFWIGDRPPEAGGAAQSRTVPSAIVHLTDNTKAAQAKDEAQQIQDAVDEAQNDPRLMLLLRMLEAQTGEKIHLVRTQYPQPDAATQQRLDEVKQAGQAAQQPQRAGWGLEYDRSASHYETEQTSFSAQGVIKTADGKEIRFDLQLVMQREFQSQENVSVRAGDAVKKDPLVINFSGTAAQLTDTKFAFDINADGTQDKISFVGSGSGFLALDNNGNGKIDNGSELFGTKSGNGFADLAKYDSDGNHWIDQNDAVYDKLRVWAKDASGKDSLTTLAQRGVGALYLGSIATPFSAKSASNTLQGQVRASGAYLNENGTAGTLQQVDLAV